MNEKDIREAIRLTNLLITDEKDEINLSELFKNDEKIVKALTLLQNLSVAYCKGELVRAKEVEKHLYQNKEE